MRSAKTFDEELVTIGDIPGVLYDSECDYIDHAEKHSPFVALQESERWFRAPLEASLERIDAVRREPRPLRHIPGTQHVFTHSLAKIYTASRKSDEALAEMIYEETGVDLEKALDACVVAVVGGHSSGLGALTADFGLEAFGCYLPWHAFVRSPHTPWGIYLFLEPLWLWATRLYVHSPQLPTPKPPLLTLFNLVFQVTFRHELFHYHVERCAIRQEVMQRRPVYRPYVEDVRTAVAGTADWLDEALAQAVVLDSTLVTHRSGFSHKAIKRLFVHEFQTFPPGYRDFACPAYGGPARAHKYLGAQLARGERTPQHLVTAMATPLQEYRVDAASVPGYIVWHPAVASRFQLTLPKTHQFKRFARQCGIEHVGPGPGDHAVYQYGNEKFQLNVKRGEVDLASMKDLTRIMGTSLYRLLTQIRDA